jgi:hypothetical protein
MDARGILRNGLIDANPGFVQLLGLCPLLAVSSSVGSALGLGDRIEERRSDWIHGFDGRSLGDPPVERWQVRKDGGDFDQFTGATVTPRAIVRAVRNALVYFSRHRDELFAAPSPPPAP